MTISELLEHAAKCAEIADLRGQEDPKNLEEVVGIMSSLVASTKRWKDLAEKRETAIRDAIRVLDNFGDSLSVSQARDILQSAVK